jgi:hypothetical protein
VRYIDDLLCLDVYQSDSDLLGIYYTAEVDAYPAVGHFLDVERRIERAVQAIQNETCGEASE